MIIFLAIIWIIIQWYSILFSDTYLAELIISFAPYMIAGSIFLLILLILRLIWQRWWLWIVFCLIISYLIIIWYRWYIVLEHYEITPAQHTASSWSALDILYANIYYQNENLSWLIDSIQRHDPDIILFVEYAKIHDEALTSIIRQSYPYVSRYVGKRWYDGDIIFSRYSLDKVNHPLNPGSFSHVQLTKNDTLYDLLLVHTSAPVSKGFFEMRNRQLDELHSIITDYMKAYPESNIIIAGDFNVSPWSHYYRIFDTSLQHLGVTNQTTALSHTTYDETKIPLTRCHEQFPFACSHIDHIRSNIPLSLSQIRIDWSDHLGFIGQTR